MLDRSRLTTLSWALLCFALFAVFAVLVTHDWGPVTSLDQRGGSLERWSVDERWLRQPLRLIETAFATYGMIVLTTLLAGAMLLKNHRRAALFAVCVMLATSLMTTFLKLQIGRGRPPWQNPDGLLTTQSFPSGHASSVTAFAGIIVVLVIMLVRRSSSRRLAYAACAALVVVVCADRVLLGRHYPSDVTAGALLGAGMVLLGLTVYNPLPRSHAEGSEPLPEVHRSARRLAVVLNPIKVEDAGQFRAIVSAMAAEARLVGADLALHDDRGPRGGDGGGGRGPGRRPGPRVRRRRHGPRGVRRAGRHRDPGRDRPRRHRQPAGPQPGHPALPAGRHRRRAQRPGPGHRPGRRGRRRDRGRPLPGDGRDGLRRRDHGGRQRGHQEADRLVRLRAVRG